MEEMSLEEWERHEPQCSYLDASKASRPSTVRKLARVLDVDPQGLLSMAAAGSPATEAQQRRGCCQSKEAEAKARHRFGRGTDAPPSFVLTPERPAP